MDSTRVFSEPKLRLIRWLLQVGQDIPVDIQRALVASLFGTLPIFIGGVANTIVIATIAAIRQPTPWFLAWIIIELALGAVRIGVLRYSIRAAGAGRSTPTDLYVFLALLWAASVGYGAVISMLSGDWTVATLACLSTAAMAGGICFRNFGAPRLASVMMLLSIGPIGVAALFAGEPIFLVALLQIPFYLYSMSVAATKLNRMLVTTMRAERDNERRARHDVLTGLLNRAGLSVAIENNARLWEDGSGALLYLDLVGFKQINDSFGHPAGDLLLKSLAVRFAALVDGKGVAARVGGDEFVLLAHDTDRDQAQALANSVIAAVALPFESELGIPGLGVTVGIAMTSEHGSDLETLLARADKALYRARLQPGSATCFATSQYSC